MKITAGTITQYNDLDSGTTMQNLPWSITDNDIVLSEGNQGFALEVTAGEMREFLTNCLATFKQDAEIAAQTKEQQAKLDNATAVAQEISGLEIM